MHLIVDLSTFAVLEGKNGLIKGGPNSGPIFRIISLVLTMFHNFSDQNSPKSEIIQFNCGHVPVLFILWSH